MSQGRRPEPCNVAPHVLRSTDQWLAGSYRNQRAASRGIRSAAVAAHARLGQHDAGRKDSTLLEVPAPRFRVTRSAVAQRRFPGRGNGPGGIALRPAAGKRADTDDSALTV